MKSLLFPCFCLLVFNSCASTDGDEPAQQGGQANVEGAGAMSSSRTGGSAMMGQTAGTSTTTSTGGIGNAATSPTGGLNMDAGGSSTNSPTPPMSGGQVGSGGTVMNSETLGGAMANEPAQRDGTAQVDCPAEQFLSVDDFQGPGGSYPAPLLEVSCTDTDLVVRSNGIPHYTFSPFTPNALQAQNFNWTIPLQPTYRMDTSPIPCLGTAGFSINGIPIYGPNEAQRPDPYGDPVANDVMDEAEGHTGGQGDYHYHALIEAAFSDQDGDGVPDLFDDEEAIQSGPSPILGYALDGFPIYGSRGCVDADCSAVVTFKSGYESTRYEQGSVGCSRGTDCADADAYICAPTVVDGQVTTACVYKDYAWDNHRYLEKEGAEWLDECNGRIGPDGTYRYHATTTFPYILGCYHGVVENVRQDVCPEEGAAASGMDGGAMMMPGARMPPQAATEACTNQNADDQCEFMDDGMTLTGTCRMRPGSGMLICIPPMP
ncbi:MAG: YHYH protein [Myxococcota bacterium]|nr:YHYH protein [Myxococcota bacterium]